MPLTKVMSFGVEMRKHPVFMIVFAYLLYKQIRSKVSPRFYESRRDQLGRLVLSLSAYARKKFAQKFNQQRSDSRKSTMKRWARYGDAITTLPENGLDPESVRALIKFYSSTTNALVTNQHYSGSIYSNSLNAEQKVLSRPTLVPKERKLTTTEDLEALSNELKALYADTFPEAYLWNSLHINEFAIGHYLAYSVTQMVSHMYGGGNDVQGMLTTGGTASLMNAVRIYRNWGHRANGIPKGECVVIAPITIHAAVPKAGMAYGVTVVHCRADVRGYTDLKHMEELMRQYKPRLVAIFGSAPNYGTGVVDDFPAMAALARKYKVGLHVDACLGGFIVNQLDQHDTNYLSIPGVTSLSTDTHKNGWAPKGSSVLLLRSLNDDVLGPINASYFSVYSIPEWSGGVYATASDPGSESCMAALHAFVALITVGKNGYKQLANLVHGACKDIAASIKQHPELEVVVEPQVNVVMFRANPNGPWPKEAIYSLVAELDKRGFTMSSMKDCLIHYCVTGRFAGNPGALAAWHKALADAVAAVNATAARVKASNGKEQFSGDAGVYGSISDAMEPDAAALSTSSYLENWLMGNRGARDAIKAFFMGLLAPFDTSQQLE